MIRLDFGEHLSDCPLEIKRYYKNNYYCTIDIIAKQVEDEWDLFSHNNIFKTKFQFEFKSIKQLEKMLKDLHMNTFDKFMSKHFPKLTLVQEWIQKAENWINEDLIVEPVYIEDYNKRKVEFIRCNKETSFHGNVEHNGEEGVYCNAGKINQKEPFEWKFELDPYFSEYQLSYQIQQNLGNISFYKKSKEEIISILKSIGLNDGEIHTFIINAYKYAAKYALYEKPYRIHLYGNDDDSYTRYFNTEEDMNKELFRLRRCQPLDKQIDVIYNGYVFTN